MSIPDGAPIGRNASGKAPVAASTAALELTRISHRFGVTRAVDDVSLAVDQGEFVVFLGPSGCGKTTILRMIGGFVHPNEGQVAIAGSDVGRLAPEDRGVGIVFQNYALFPHLTVAGNIGYGLRARRVATVARNERIQAMLRLVRMEALADRYPRQLSGGQQQRVALARALAIGPSILLLDEPFAALDKNLRADMQIELKRIQREAGITTIMVTHDQDEALALADRIAVFNAGRLEQIDTPEDVYDAPASRFVSGFVGSTNFLSGRLVENDATARIELDNGAKLKLPHSRPCGRLGPVVVSIRPENLRLADTDNDAALSGIVTSVVSRGTTIAYGVSVGSDRMQVVEMRGRGVIPEPGSHVHLTVVEPALCPVYIA